MAGRVLARVADLRNLPGWIRRNPLRTSLASAVALAIGVGIVFAISWTTPARPEPTAALSQALAALDAGDDLSARELAMQVRTNLNLSYGEVGGPLYVLGITIAHDADRHWNPAERRLLYLVAAKYLEEARNRGFPEGREMDGTFQLGRCWQLAGEYRKSIDPLRAVSEEGPAAYASLARQLLPEAYLQVVPPQYTKALQANTALLADPAAGAKERIAGLLREGRIRLALRDLPGCRQSLEQIPAEASRSADFSLLKGQLLLAEGDALLAANPPDAEAAKALFTTAADTFRSIPVANSLDKNPPLAAQYLLGLSFERLGDDAAAEAQFDRVRRQNATAPEVLAATLHQVELLARRKDFDEAVELLARFATEVDYDPGQPNPWVSAPDFERRLGQLQQSLLDAAAFDAALKLAELPPGIVAPWQLVLWKANAFEARAAAAEQEAATAPLTKAETLRATARADRRRAGREAAQLAELRQLSRDYTDDLWRAAGQYYLGRDFNRAIAVTRVYLRNESKNRRPDALLLLGESLLALDRTDQAIEPLTDCLESFPKHPATYQARLVAAQASAEKGLLAEAKALLTENVSSDELSPRSSQWRDSLFLLGRLLYREGVEREAKSRAEGIDSDDPDRTRAALHELEQAHAAFRGAIDQLGRAVERYPDVPQAREAQYLLADSHRQAAKWPRKRMKVVTIEATRAVLARQSQLDLLAAIAEYDKLITQLGDVQDSPNHTQLEKQILRNGYFSKADALFDLGRYDDAIKAYSAASNRYQNEPEALEAYVQIAACYRLLDKPNEARGTLQQAQAVLSRMKPDADFTRATPYNREEWKQLLSWLATL
jgi:TolA-binding protein